MEKFTENQISDFYQELKRQSKNGKVDGIDWNPLDKIAEKSFDILPIIRNRGWVKTEVLDGTYGHSVHFLTH